MIPGVRIISFRLWLDKNNKELTSRGAWLVRSFESCARCKRSTDKFEGLVVGGDTFFMFCEECYEDGRSKFGDAFLAYQSGGLERRFSDWLRELTKHDLRDAIQNKSKQRTLPED